MTEKGRKITVDKFHKINRFADTDEERHPLLLGQGTPPADLCLLTYIIFYLQGVGHLLPWNFFITANEYFTQKFTCPKDGNSSCYGFEDTFENYFSVASMLPIFVMGGVNVWLQSKVHYKYRMVLALLTMLVLFAVTTAFVGIPTKSWVDGFFVVTLLSVIIMNMASSIFQSSTFGFAGVLPMKYTSIVMSGQACAGIFAALANIIFTAAATNTVDSTFGYFSTAMAVILLCILTFFLLLRLRFVQFYLSQTSVKSQKAKQEAAVRASVNVKAVDTSPPFWAIFRSIWMYAVSVFLVFTVTISLFPAVLSSIKSTSPDAEASPWTDKYFTPIVCFLLFNVADFVGRFITHWVMAGSNRFVLLTLCALRVWFIPLFLLCNAQGTRGKRGLPIVFYSDAFPIIFNLLFALSNGYFSSVAMVTAPQSVPHDQRETASTIMAFFLSGGLLCGGGISFLWTWVVTQ